MENLERYIDHTLLKPDATIEMIEELCNDAKKYNFCSVCISTYYVELCRKLLLGSNVKICCVIGFPLGANSSSVKAIEAKEAIINGADELDMVINIAALKNKDYGYVLNDIKSVVNEAKNKALLKVIIETCLLNDDEKIEACKLSILAGADFVKTSTGFSSGNATVDDVILMKSVVKDKCKVKASGGIRNLEDARSMIIAGADRLGTSGSVKIMNELINK